MNATQLTNFRSNLLRLSQCHGQMAAKTTGHLQYGHLAAQMIVSGVHGALLAALSEDSESSMERLLYAIKAVDGS